MAKARAPFSNQDMDNIRQLLRDCKAARKEMDRAERVGVDQTRNRAELDKAEKTLSAVLHEYEDESRP